MNTHEPKDQHRAAHPHHPKSHVTDSDIAEKAEEKHPAHHDHEHASGHEPSHHRTGGTGHHG